MYSVSGPGQPGELTAPGSAGGLPAAIDGLDLQQMRSRLGCEDEILLAILRQFACDFDAWRGQFDLEQQAQNTDAMVRLAHTLKGTAANVCANEVQAAALALETALRQGAGQTAGLVQDCDVALQRVLMALRQHLPSEEAPQSATMPPAQAIQVVQEVAVLLQRRRHVPHSLLQELRAAVAPVASAEQLEALWRQLAAFEFKNAQQTLADIHRRMSA